MSVSRNARHGFKGVLAVFLIYFYFLEFSQFTLLHLLDERISSDVRIKAVLGTMAASGIAGSLLAVFLRRCRLSWSSFFPAFIICALVALAASQATGFATFLFLSGLMGMALGLLTVSTAALVPLMMPAGHHGLGIGLGTGLAYAVSNLPFLFTASAEVRSLGCGIVLLAGAPIFIGWKGRDSVETETHPDGASSPSAWLGKWLWIVVGFLLLIWLDSALFYIIQENRSLKDMSWGGNAQLTGNALIHFLVALAAGWLLDHGQQLVLLPLAWLGLAVGAVGLQYLGWGGFTMAYLAGVSLYSCALVFLPSWKAAVPGDVASFVRAAMVYTIAGWIGSGLGIGMAENLSGVPLEFVAVSGLLLLPVVKLSLQDR